MLEETTEVVRVVLKGWLESKGAPCERRMEGHVNSPVDCLPCEGGIFWVPPSKLYRHCPQR